MALSDKQVRSAKPSHKPYKLADSLGLYLLVKPNGSRIWYLKYRFEGKESRVETVVNNAMKKMVDELKGKSYHGACAEINAIQAFLNNGGRLDDLDGMIIETVKLARQKGGFEDKTNIVVEACDCCKEILNHFGITDAYKILN